MIPHLLSRLLMQLCVIVHSLPEFSLFFKQITIQLLAGAEEDRNLCNGAATLHKTEMDCSIAFVGEAFARICRRGSAGNT